MHDDFEPGPRKTAQEIARRSIVLQCVAQCGEYAPGRFNEWLKQEGLWEDVSPAEQSLLTSELPEEKQLIDASWRCEALQVMLWSIGKLTELPPLTEVAHVASLFALLPGFDSETASFIESAKLRPQAEIDAQLDEAIHAHAKLQQERTRHGKRSPMIPGVVLERQWALEWIENFDDVPWDEITLNA